MAKISNLVSLSLSFLVIILFPSAPSLVASQGNDLVANTCQKTPNAALCNKILGADPRSKSATDVKGLALISVDILKTKSTETTNQIKRLLASSPQLKVPLSQCDQDYSIGILQGDIPVAVEALTKGDPKFAEQSVVDAGFEADNCETGFSPSPSPLTALNSAVHDIAVVGQGIIKQLL